MNAPRSRLVVQQTGRERLRAAGDRMRRAKQLIEAETEVASSLVGPLLSTGISVTEIAELLGVSRQTVYDLRRRGSDEDMRHRVLAYLSAGGATPLTGLMERTGGDAEGVSAAVDDLVSSGLADRAVMEYQGGEPVAWYRVTPTGITTLEEWIWRSSQRPQLWSVYVPMLPEDRESLVRVAVEVFGPTWFAVLEPGTIHGQSTAELAFNVTADSFEEAQRQAAVRTRELHEAAGVGPSWAIRAILPADVWHAEFGTGT